MVALSVLWFCSYGLTHTTIFVSGTEHLAEMFPYLTMADMAWKGGEFPLWSPQLLCGFPVAGWPHASAFYPWSWIFRVWDFSFASVVNLSLHLLIFGLGLLVLLRALSLGEEGAVFGSLMITFGAFLSLCQWNFLPNVYTYAWSSWLFAFAVRILKSPRFGNLAGIAVAFAFQISGGRYEFIVRELMLMGLLGCALILWRPSLLPRVGLWMAGGLIGSLLVSALGLVHYEYFSHSIRSLGFSFQFLRASQSDPNFLILLGLWILTPSSLFALWGLRFGARRGLVGAAASVMGVSVLWIAAPSFWVRIASLVPFLNRLREPSVSIIFAFLSLGVLAGEGVQGWMKKSIPLRALWVFAGVSAFFAFIQGISWFFLQAFTPSEANPFAVFTFGWLRGRAAASITFGILALLLFAMARKNWKRSSLTSLSTRSKLWILAGFMGADLLAMTLVGTVRLPSRRFPQSPLASRWKQNAYLPYRAIHLFPWSDWHRLTLPLQAGSEPWTRALDAFITMPILQYSEFLRILSPRLFEIEAGHLGHESFMGAFKEPGFLRPQSLALLNYLNVKYFCIERTNLKFGPDFHFRWEPPESLVFQGSWASAGEAKVWKQTGAASWQEKVAPAPGTRFRTGIEVASPSPWMLQLLLEEEPQHQTHLTYSRAWAQPKSFSSIPASLEVPFPKWASSTITVHGAGIPVRADSGECRWHDPLLFSEQRPLKFLFRSGEVEVLDNPAAFPLFSLVHQAVLIPDPMDRLRYLGENPDRLRFEAVLERPLDHPVIPANPRREYLRMLDYRDQKLVFQARLDQPGLIVSSEASYPGWEAVDQEGTSYPILRVNHAFRGLWLPLGNHVIQMRYHPWSFRIGFGASLSAICLLLGVCFFNGMNHLRQIRSQRRLPSEPEKI